MALLLHPATVIEVHGIAESIVMEARRSRPRTVHPPGLSLQLPEEKLPAGRLVVEIVAQHGIRRPSVRTVAETDGCVALSSAAQKFPTIVPPGLLLLDPLGQREAIFSSRQAAEYLVEVVAAKATSAAEATAAAHGNGGGQRALPPEARGRKGGRERFCRISHDQLKLTKQSRPRRKR